MLMFAATPFPLAEKSPDLPMSILLVLMGLAFLALRKRMIAARQARVRVGDLSDAAAKRKDRWYTVASIGVIGCGLYLLIVSLLKR